MVFERKGSHRQADDQISAKANLVLNVVLAAMLLIVLRIWHLSVIQYEERLEQARKPQHRLCVEPAKRATIRDRFNIPFAINKVQYNVSMLYSQLRQIPTASWDTTPEGQRIKRFRRKEYIASLSQILGKELGTDPERIEDLIHAKGPYYQQIPFILQDDISETQYYRLKMLEKDWLGIHVQRVPRRYYPQGKVAGDIIGYMGAINRQEYDKIIQDIQSLENYLEGIEAGELLDLPEGMMSEQDVLRRLDELREHAYTINDFIGKTGVEGRFEESLRGFRGKKSYQSDARGNYLRELPGSQEPLSGQRLLLTISSELQAFAEQLLIQNEKIRVTRLTTLETVKRTILALKQPWIKGGAIVALDPNTGDVLAMASFPRYNPNDFIPSGNPELMKQKRSNVLRWLESPSYLAEVWNQKRPLEREIFNEETEQLQEETLFLTWDNYLQIILSPESPIQNVLNQIVNVRKAIELQNNVEKLLELSGQNNLFHVLNILYSQAPYKPHGKKLSAFEKELLEKNLKEHQQEVDKIKQKIDPYLQPLNLIYDQVLLIDLLRLVVNKEHFTPDLLKKKGDQTLSDYRAASAAMATISDTVMKMTKELFHELDFKQWRQENEKEFLKEKRVEEKEAKKSPKPYIDYFDAKENELFQQFWNEHRWQFIRTFLTKNDAFEEKLEPYFSHFNTWEKEIRSGAHQSVDWKNAYFILKQSINNLNAELAEQYLRTLRSFQQLDRPLLGKYPHLRKEGQQQLEKHLAAAFYPKNGYGFGRSQTYRQATTQGSIFKLVPAYEAMIQRYPQLKKNEIDFAHLNPLEMVDTVFHKGKELYLGYQSDGQPLPRFYKGGRLPKSSSSSLGKLDLIKAIETSSNPYFALLAGDVLKSPQDLTKAARQFCFGSKTGIELPGEIAGKVPDDVESNRTGLYSLSIGQHTLVVTPLQTAVMLSAIANGGKVLKPKIVRMKVGDVDRSHQNTVLYTPTKIKREIFMPQKIREILLEGMRRVVVKTQAESLGSLSKLYHNHPEAISDYVELKDQLIGKTSTSESMENLDLDLLKGTNMYTHVWFGGISFSQEKPTAFMFKDSFGKPEIVVVVYLRYGGFGKEAAPVAAQIVKKWREIKTEHTVAEQRTKRTKKT